MKTKTPKLKINKTTAQAIAWEIVDAENARRRRECDAANKKIRSTQLTIAGRIVKEINKCTPETKAFIEGFVMDNSNTCSNTTLIEEVSNFLFNQVKEHPTNISVSSVTNKVLAASVSCNTVEEIKQKIKFD